MVSFSRLAVVAVAASGTYAAPWPTSSKHSTHRTRKVAAHGIEVSTYHPKSTYETYGAGISIPLTKRGDSIEDKAASFLIEKLGMSLQDISIRTTASVDTGTHVWAQRKVNNIPVVNAVANVAFNRNQDVVAFGSNFDGSSARLMRAPDPPTAAITKEAAIAAAEGAVSGKYNGANVDIAYFQTDDDHLVLTYVVQVVTPDPDYHWFQSFINAADGTAVAHYDFVADSSYVAVDQYVQDVTQKYATYTDPEDKIPSPNGWHTVSGTTSTDTTGNNVISYKGATSSTTTQSASGNVFNYKYDTTQDPTVGDNVKAATVNTFYIVNKVHDITYRYGFTESTFNFQQDNAGKGGKGNDRVKISVQDGGGTNNANFATPPDGQSGQMRMYIWTQSTPNRDGALSNDVITHEAFHGVSNRMTGGGTGTCLETQEAGGMGEGWSDAFAEFLEHTDSSVHDFVLGAWVSNNAGGVRSHPYSTDKSVNPLMYSNVGMLGEVHAIGEVWANILHNVYAALVGAKGFNPAFATSPDATEGNVLYFHLIIDGLLLQPCNPTFIQARDAIVQADANRFGGANKCLLWKAFASRGLGTNAADFTDDSTVPDDCSSAAH